MVSNMEAGTSYFQTADPRYEVEKIVMDGLGGKKNRKRKCRSRSRERGRVSNGRDQQGRDQRKGKSERNLRKGEHDSKGRLGSKGVRCDTRSEVNDEHDEDTRQDARKMVVVNMTKEEDERVERVRVAPNMGAGGSHSQATTDPKEKEAQENRAYHEMGRLHRRGAGMAKGGRSPRRGRMS